MPTAKSGGHKSRNDLIFIVCLLIVLCVAGLCFYLLRGKGDTVTVTVDGAHFATYALSEDRTVDIITGEGKDEHNILVIENGKARVESATCPDGICSSHKPIYREGESIVCLPHRVVITVSTAEDANAPDIVV